MFKKTDEVHIETPIFLNDSHQFPQTQVVQNEVHNALCVSSIRFLIAAPATPHSIPCIALPVYGSASGGSEGSVGVSANSPSIDHICALG